MKHGALSVRERGELTELERRIERGIAAFIRVGSALGEIRSRKLYRDGYLTFKQYLRERWSMDDAVARRLIRAAKVAEEIGGLNYSQALALARVPTEHRRRVFDTARKGGMVSARKIQRAAFHVIKADSGLIQRARTHLSGLAGAVKDLIDADVPLDRETIAIALDTIRRGLP